MSKDDRYRTVLEISLFGTKHGGQACTAICGTSEPLYFPAFAEGSGKWDNSVAAARLDLVPLVGPLLSEEHI